MIRTCGLLAAILLGACAAPPAARESTGDDAVRVEPTEATEVEAGSLPRATTQEVWAYHAYWMGDTWRSYDLRAFGRLLFMDLPIGKSGRVQDTRGWPDQWSRLRSAARSANVQIDPAFTILTPEIFSTVFSSREARRRLVSDIVFLARFSRGVHLDVEVYDQVPGAAVEGYREFLADLRRALDAKPRKILTAFVPAASAIYGDAELALLDAVVAQGYDVHWQQSKNAGPPVLLEGESPAAWKTAAGLLSARGVPPAKILFSTPFYGYEWPTISETPRAATRATGEIITYAPIPASILPDIRTSALARIREHGLRRESPTGMPWYAYRDREGWRQGWFDDAVSLAPRLDFVSRGGYRGVAVFVLGYDNGELLGTIRAAFRERTSPSASAVPPAAR